MSEPTRPKVLPIESSILPLPPSDASYWKQYYEESQAMRIRLMRESRIRKVCLEIAMEILRHYASLTVHAAQETIDKIEARLAQLEPEEKTG